MEEEEGEEEMERKSTRKQKGRSNNRRRLRPRHSGPRGKSTVAGNREKGPS